MKLPWFRQLKSIFFFPVKPIGWVIFIATNAYAIFIAIATYKKADTIVNNVVNIGLNLVLIAALYSGVAFATCKTDKEQ